LFQNGIFPRNYLNILTTKLATTIKRKYTKS